MSVALYLSLDRDLPGVDPGSVDGKALAAAQPSLDATAALLGFTPLAHFISVNEEEARLFLEEHGVEDVPVPAEQWFDPADGLQTLRALQEYVRRDTSPSRAATALLADLEAAERVLLAAQSHHARFHLSVDY